MRRSTIMFSMRAEQSVRKVYFVFGAIHVLHNADGGAAGGSTFPEKSVTKVCNVQRYFQEKPVT